MLPFSRCVFCSHPSHAVRHCHERRRGPDLRRMPRRGKGRRHHDRTRRKQVARIERSEIRGRSPGFTAAPGFRCAQPGLQNEKEAERRQTRVSLLHLAAKRAPCAGRARLSAFHGGSAQGTHASLGAASDQASRSQHHDGGDLPPAFAPVTASTSHTGHSAGGHDVRNRPSTEATKPPPAGAASRSPPAIVTGRRPCTKSERPALLVLSPKLSSVVAIEVTSR